jgi:hypothetical protein
MRRGPLTIVLVYSTTCPHCHTYMPIWKRLCKTSGRKANMVSMEADTYQQTPMSEKKAVDGVPTVLFVDKQGRISEASTPRDERVMTNVARISTPVASSDVETVANAPVRRATPYPSSGPRQMTDDDVMDTLTEEVARASRTNSDVMAPVAYASPMDSVIPGTTVSENPLPPLPGLTQRGGAITHRGGAITQKGAEAVVRPCRAPADSALPSACLRGA